MAPPSSQDEALSRYSASGEVPRFELEVERALGTVQHADFKNFHITSCLGSAHCRESAIQYFSTDKEEILGVKKTGPHSKFHLYNAVFLGTDMSYLTDSTIMWSRHHYFKDKETGSDILH